MQSISLADELTLEAGAARQRRATRSSARACRARPSENLAAAALARVSREHRLAGAAAAAEHRQADPRRRRARRRLGRRRRHAAPGQARLGARRRAAAAHARRAARRRRARAGIARALAGDAAPASGCRSLRRRARAFGVLVLPLAADAVDRGRLRRGRPARRWRARATSSSELRRGAARGARARRAAAGRRELLHNDLQRAAVSLCPQIADALAQAREPGAEPALVSGSGPTVIGLFAARRRTLAPTAVSRWRAPRRRAARAAAAPSRASGGRAASTLVAPSRAVTLARDGERRPPCVNNPARASDEQDRRSTSWWRRAPGWSAWRCSPA